MFITTVLFLATAGTPDSLGQIRSRAEFDSIARTTNYPYPLPHVFFVIDRAHGNRIYYANSKKYDSHRAFANATYLSLERGQKFFHDNYMLENRRFYMGTLSYQSPVRKWTFEFWEGDQLKPAGLQDAYDAVKSSFFAAVSF